MFERLINMTTALIVAALPKEKEAPVAVFKSTELDLPAMYDSDKLDTTPGCGNCKIAIHKRYPKGHNFRITADILCKHCTKEGTDVQNGSDKVLPAFSNFRTFMDIEEQRDTIEPLLPRKNDKPQLSREEYKDGISSFSIVGIETGRFCSNDFNKDDTTPNID